MDDGLNLGDCLSVSFLKFYRPSLGEAEKGQKIKE